MVIQFWDIDIDPISECRLTLRQHWTDEQNNVGPMLYCNVGLTN